MFFPFQMMSLLWLYERFQYAYRTVTVLFEYGPANGPPRGVVMESEFGKTVTSRQAHGLAAAGTRSGGPKGTIFKQ
jgi:hypothetical protein